MRLFPYSRAALVWVLLLAAALACSVEFSTAHFENAGTYQDAAGTTKTRGFKPADTVYCITELKDADDQTFEVGLVLKQVGTLQTVEMMRETRMSRSDRLIFALPPPSDRWERGDYVIELYLDDDLKETLRFQVN